MLTNTLNTNEVKNAAGTEVEFTRLSIGDRQTEYQMIGELPATPFRMTIKHAETGSGLTARRRSTVRFDKSTAGQVDTTTTMKASFYIVGDIPIGNLTSNALPQDTLAALLSFCASLGASTTILYDGTGNGAAALLSGGI